MGQIQCSHRLPLLAAAADHPQLLVLIAQVVTVAAAAAAMETVIRLAVRVLLGKDMLEPLAMAEVAEVAVLGASPLLFPHPTRAATAEQESAHP
jgi:hypothetical protein